MNRKRGRILAVVLVASAGCGVLGALVLPHRLPAVDTEPIDLAAHPRFRTWDEHREIYESTEFPFVVDIGSTRGAALLVGVQHSTDADDPQFAEVRRLWGEFNPTIALNEGRSKYLRWGTSLLPGMNDPRLVYELARGEGVPVHSIEPRYQDEVDALLEVWSPELVATYLSLRVISTEAGGDPERAEKIAPALIAKRTDAEGLRNVITGAEDLDRVWHEHAPDADDWRTVRQLDSVALMRQIGDSSREARGQHMVRAITTLAQRGERVFAVVGASHVIRYEPTLRSLLGDTVVRSSD